jgi:hypothetical protein
MSNDPGNAETGPMTSGGGAAGFGGPALAGAGGPVGAAPPSRNRNMLLFVPLLIGALVSLSVGLFARFHKPTGIAVDIAGFSSAQAAKVWLCTLAAVLAVAQLISALIMYGKIKITAPSWIGRFHRWSGRLAFFATIPVAMHCLFAFGFQHSDTRVLIHSLLGCLFYGVFTVKMLVLTKRGLSGWVLPVAGGVVFTTLIGLWASSALWFFSSQGVHF